MHSLDCPVRFIYRELTLYQVDINEDDYLSLLSSDGLEKNDVKLPKGALGETIRKLFFDDGNDLSRFNTFSLIFFFPISTNAKLTLSTVVTVKNGEIIDEVINYKL